MEQLLLSLANDKQMRVLVNLFIQAVDDTDVIRDLANELQKTVTKNQHEILALRKDKAALIAFIEANITDTEKLKEIFKGDN